MDWREWIDWRYMYSIKCTMRLMISACLAHTHTSNNSSSTIFIINTPQIASLPHSRYCTCGSAQPSTSPDKHTKDVSLSLNPDTGRWRLRLASFSGDGLEGFSHQLALQLRLPSARAAKDDWRSRL